MLSRFHILFLFYNLQKKSSLTCDDFMNLSNQLLSFLFPVNSSYPLNTLLLKKSIAKITKVEEKNEVSVINQPAREQFLS